MISQILMSNFFQKVSDIVTGFFAIIPQIMYFLYASMASLLDVGQLVFRKLIGLDIYYLKDAGTGDYVAKSGDILKEFVEGILGFNNSYSSLTTVFWALIIFGVMVLILTTIMAIIKSHYNYDAQKSNPFSIIRTSLKALALMAITPVVILFSTYLSEVILQSLDKITESPTSSNITSIFENDALGRIKKVSVNQKGEDVGEEGDAYATYYISYDLYGASEWSGSATFSGKIFELISRDANRVRLGGYTATQTVSNSNWDNCGIFYTKKEGDIQEIVASQIDCAFMNNLTLTNGHTVEFLNKKQAEGPMIPSFNYGPSVIFASGLINVTHFSKFNVGLVWYYYNLWATNYLIGYIAVIACGTLMFSIMFGLMKRLIICVTLFVVQAPIIAISPLDGGNGFSQWKQKFISYFISGYGAVVGMNLFFLLIPVIESMSFFNNYFLDRLFNMIVIICGLSMIKGLVSLVSSFVGGADLAKEGDDLKGSMGTLATGAAIKTIKTATLGLSVGRYAMTGGINAKLIKKFAMSTGLHMNKERNNNQITSKLAKTRLDGDAEKRKGKDKVKPSVNPMLKIGKVFNSKLARGFLRYMAVAPVPLDNAIDIDAIRNEEIQDESTGEMRKRTKAEVKAIVNEKKAQQGMQVLRMAGQNLEKLLGAFGSELAKSTGFKSVIDKIAEAGGVDQAKMFAQEAMKIGGIDPSVIESIGADSKAMERWATTKQREKRAKKQKEEELKNIREAAEASERFTKEAFNLVEMLKKKV